MCQVQPQNKKGHDVCNKNGSDRAKMGACKEDCMHGRKRRFKIKGFSKRQIPFPLGKDWEGAVVSVMLIYEE